jgi:hypothetical protein
LTVSVFELIDRALDHLYTVNNVLPDNVDDEVTQELGNAIEVCEKIYNEFKPKEKNYYNVIEDRLKPKEVEE